MAGLYPPLWQHHGAKCTSSSPTIGDLLNQFSEKPQPTPWSTLCKNTLVVGQEFTLTCFFLARHRTAQYEEQGRLRMEDGELKHILSFAAIPAALFVVAVFSDSQRSRQKTQTRLVDALLLAVLLRMLAAVLRTLTASYSSDTVHALSILGMVIHLFGCDYSYANGVLSSSSAAPSRIHSSSTRAGVSPFLGGTMSLNAAFFSTTLLASRLASNWTVHFFVSSSVTIFAFFPATRHGLFVKSSEKAPYVILLSTLILAIATWVQLEKSHERILFVSILASICLVAPTWKYCCLQKCKVHINGPWDIAHMSS